jgi:hypothetical protein
MNDYRSVFADNQQILHFRWSLRDLINHKRHKQEEEVNALIYVLND